MAIDTRDKRASVLSHTVQNLGRPWLLPSAGRVVLGLSTKSDRQHMAFLYNGIDAASPGGNSAPLYMHHLKTMMGD